MTSPLPRADALAAARAAMLAEARSNKRTSWYQSLALVAGVGVSLLAVIAFSGLRAGAFSAGVVESHVHVMAMLTVVSLLLWVAAFRPAGRGWRRLSGAVGLVAMALLVVLRADTPVVDTTRFSCTLSHLGVAIVPAVVTLVALRRAAFNITRAFCAGLGVGALGAFAGELGCQQGPTHVLLYHLPAWVLSTVVITWVASKLAPRSFAP